MAKDGTDSPNMIQRDHQLARQQQQQFHGLRHKRDGESDYKYLERVLADAQTYFKVSLK